MWQTIRKQIIAIRGLINEYNQWSSILKSSSSIRSLSTSQIIEPPTSNLQLVTAHSGFSKDYFSGHKTSTNNQRKFTIGDDSW